MCYKGIQDRRTIEVNYRNNAFRAEAKRLLTGERGLFHRSNRPIEPEAVFGDIKFNHGFRRFRLKSNEKVKIEFGLVALAHNLRKYIAHNANRADGMELRRASFAFQRTVGAHNMLWSKPKMAC